MRTEGIRGIYIVTAGRQALPAHRRAVSQRAAAVHHRTHHPRQLKGSPPIADKTPPQRKSALLVPTRVSSLPYFPVRVTKSV